MIEILNSRAVICISGPERKKLLQGVITNNIDRLKDGTGLYSALLSPQGKFLYDFFLFEKYEIIYLDCEAKHMAKLFQKLLMYRLRSNVEIIDQSNQFKIISSTKQLDKFDLNYTDPRHTEMGFRAIVNNIPEGENEDVYHIRRIKLGIPEGTHDFIMDKSTVLEGHFEEINGVDFEKGCYVGQEVTARMKYRGKVKKQMLPVTLSGPAPEFGTDIIDEKGNKVGDLRSSCDKNAIALFRIDKITLGQEYACGDINVTPKKPSFMPNMKDNDHD